MHLHAGGSNIFCPRIQNARQQLHKVICLSDNKTGKVISPFCFESIFNEKPFLCSCFLHSVILLKSRFHFTSFLFLQNAYKCSCSPKTYVLKVAPEHLYKAMIDSVRQQFYPRMRQAVRDRKISDCYRKGYSCTMCEKTLSR